MSNFNQIYILNNYFINTVDDKKTLRDFEETKNVAESLDRINLMGCRMHLYDNMTRQLNELRTQQQRYNSGTYIALKKRIVDTYLKKVKDIDYQLNKHGIMNNNARPYTREEFNNMRNKR